MITSELVELVDSLAGQCLRSSLVVIGLLLIRLSFKKYLAAKWSYLIGVLAGCWLLLPMTPPSITSVWQWLPTSPEIELQPPIIPTNIDPYSFPDQVHILSESDMLLDPSAGTSLGHVGNSIEHGNLSKRKTIFLVLVAIWFAGSLSFGLIWLGREMEIRFKVYRGEEVVNRSIVKLLDESICLLGVKQKVRLIRTQQPISPALVGLFKPCILVGSDFEKELSVEQMGHVFMHELIHLQRLDLMTRFLIRFAVIYQWPNPVAWWLMYVSSVDVELATDEKVLSQLTSENDRQNYGRSLLTVARSLAHRRIPFSANLLGMADSPKSHLETRIKMIVNYTNKRKRGLTPICLMLVLSIAVGSLVGFSPIYAQSVQDKENKPKNSSVGDFPVPDPPIFGNPILLQKELDQWLQNTIIPSLVFEDAKLIDVLTFIQKRSETLVGGPLMIEFSEKIKIDSKPSDKRVSVNLKDVSIGEALIYVTNLANLQYHILANKIYIHQTTELFTHSYIVPPIFLSLNGGDSDQHINAKTVLENVGVIFGFGSTAIYHSESKIVIVRNTMDQLQLVDAYVKDLILDRSSQFAINARVVIGDNPMLDEIRSNMGNVAKVKPGVAKSFEDADEMKEFLYSEKIKDDVQKSIQSSKILNEKGVKNFGISAIFTEPQLEMVLSELAEIKSVEVRVLPTIIVRSGQSGVVAGKELALGITPVLGADNYLINLDLLPRILIEGEHFSLNKAEKVTIWDTQTVGLSGKLDKDRNAFLLVSATIVDHAGQPVYLKESEANKGEGGSR